MIDTRKAAETVKSPEETRERILSAAREVIARKGKRGATTREIADVAGVNEATLFRHFGTKEALIVAVAQHFCKVAELRDVASVLHGDLAEDLFTIGNFMLKNLTSQWDMIRWSLVDAEYDADLFATTAWRPQVAILSVFIEFLEPRIASGELRGDPMKIAQMFLGMVFMHVLGRTKFADSPLYGEGDDAALRYYIEVLLNGVRG
ncbi:MAG: TetR/AcrR family transcriptional regulator [Candidatus Eremiobacteraeota bacterium]|nr:TetR/AcrR family transcriptional regulator [Candidatus Eremiobacteraeota bacterium]